jgi:CheY-like chemotaxis protein
VVKQIRRIIGYRDIQIVAVTAFAMKGDKEERLS